MKFHNTLLVLGFFFLTTNKLLTFVTIFLTPLLYQRTIQGTISKPKDFELLIIDPAFDSSYMKYFDDTQYYRSLVIVKSDNSSL